MTSIRLLHEIVATWAVCNKYEALNWKTSEKKCFKCGVGIERRLGTHFFSPHEN